jgi:hypothetical protein
MHDRRPGSLYAATGEPDEDGVAADSDRRALSGKRAQTLNRHLPELVHRTLPDRRFVPYLSSADRDRYMIREAET